jgi:hypothetical protein
VRPRLLFGLLLCASPAFAQVLALAPVAPPKAPEPTVRIERPYLTWARARPKGEVAAAALDEQIARWNVGGTGDGDSVSSHASFHPGTRVKVDTRVIAGHLPKTAPTNRKTGKRAVVLSDVSLRARARKYGYWPFRLCYEDAARRGTHPKGGETTVRFRVSSAGRVSHARRVRTKLDDEHIVDCIVERAEELDLLPPPRAVEVELSVSVWPGDAPVPRLDPPPEGERDVKLDADALERVSQTATDTIAACYAEGLERDAALWGRVQLHFELAPNGAVQSLSERESRFPDAAVTGCVRDAFRSLAFPARKNRLGAFDLGVRLGVPPAPPAQLTP